MTFFVKSTLSMDMHKLTSIWSRSHHHQRKNKYFFLTSTVTSQSKVNSKLMRPSTFSSHAYKKVYVFLRLKLLLYITLVKHFLKLNNSSFVWRRVNKLLQNLLENIIALKKGWRKVKNNVWYAMKYRKFCTMRF